jgi:glycine oxidase
MASTTDVVVIGGGVIGISVAYHLARQNVRTLLVEKNTLGQEASSAAAGMLAATSAGSRRGPMYQLKSASQALYPALIRELEERTGIDIECQTPGIFEILLTEVGEKHYRRLYELRSEQGHAVSWLSAEEARRREPGLTPGLRAAVHFADDHHLHNGKLTEAWTQAAQQCGVTLRTGTSVQEVRMMNGRVSQVRIGDEWVSADTIVIAAGSWSAQVGEVFGITIPIQPAKGQMLSIRTTQLRHVISCDDRYLVPRKNGEVIIGSTIEFIGHNKDVTLEAIQLLAEWADTIVPGISQAPLSRFWAGLRPYSPTRRPILCRAPGLDNLVLATGHHRNGILLAPITGQLITELITTGQTAQSLEPFGLPVEPVSLAEPGEALGEME